MGIPIKYALIIFPFVANTMKEKSTNRFVRPLISKGKTTLKSFNWVFNQNKCMGCFRKNLSLNITT